MVDPLCKVDGSGLGKVDNSIDSSGEVVSGDGTGGMGTIGVGIGDSSKKGFVFSVSGNRSIEVLVKRSGALLDNRLNLDI